jgi:hypothetical protein
MLHFQVFQLYLAFEMVITVVYPEKHYILHLLSLDINLLNIFSNFERA